MKNYHKGITRFLHNTTGALLTLLIFSTCFSCYNNKETTDGKDEGTRTALTASKSELSALIGQDLIIDDQHSYIGFKIKYFGNSPVRGRFDNFDGTVFYDPENLGALSVSLNIEVSSINTGVEMRDNDLQTDGPGWFNVKDFPKISFSSRKVELHEDSTFSLIGDLTMNGIKQEISAHFTSTTPMTQDLFANDQVDFSGSMVLDRLDFEVSGGDFWSKIMENGISQLSHDVEIEIDIHTRRTDYLARMASEDSTNVRVIIPKMVAERGVTDAIRELRRLKTQPDSPVSSGALSTIGYILLAQNKLEEAKAVFLLRKELFPGRITSHSQLGIVALKQDDLTEARRQFANAMAQDSTDSRAIEYLKLMDKINP